MARLSNNCHLFAHNIIPNISALTDFLQVLPAHSTTMFVLSIWAGRFDSSFKVQQSRKNTVHNSILQLELHGRFWFLQRLGFALRQFRFCLSLVGRDSQPCCSSRRCRYSIIDTATRDFMTARTSVLLPTADIHHRPPLCSTKRSLMYGWTLPFCVLLARSL